jgi:hypothetical protein
MLVINVLKSEIDLVFFLFEKQILKYFISMCILIYGIYYYTFDFIKRS